MYTLFLLASLTTCYFIYKKIKKLFTIKDKKFEDLTVTSNKLKFELLDITYEDNTREFIEEIANFSVILQKEKPIKYVTVNYSIGSKSHCILFNKDNLKKLASMTFPFYENITILPLYREVKEVIILVDDADYDVTNVVLDFEGPKFNYHSDIVKVFFEEILDYSQEFPELLGVKGVVNIVDNFDNKHVYDYPGEFTWNENLIDLKT